MSKSQQLAELIFFLFVVLPAVGIGFGLLLPEDSGFTGVAVSTIAQDLLLLAVVLFLLHRRGESVRTIGWRHYPLREILLGIGLFIPLFFALGILDSVLRKVGFSAPESLPAILIPEGTPDVVLAIVFILVVAVVEESIFRGYLMLRITGITGSPIAGVLLSAVIFGFGHGYEGSAGMIAVTFVGIFFGLVYWWRGSLWAPVAMHVLQNGVTLILLPQLTAH